jgi:hypothetical protein
MAAKRKAPSSGSRSSKGRKDGKRRQPAPRQIVPEPPLQQGLIELATMGAQSFLWMVFVTAILAAVGGLAFAAWTQRPVPAYGSERVEVGSPFDATFRVENSNPWLPLARPKISCVVSYAGEPNIPPIEASNLQMPAGSPAQLEPGASATFKCPFRTALRGRTSDDLETALRSEIYFRTTYEVPLPLIGAIPLTDHRGPFLLNTKLLPPRWAGKP